MASPARPRVSPAPAVREAARRTDPAVAQAMRLDRVIHERFRLGMVSALATSPSLTFTELKGLLGATDGNLSVHAKKLEEAGYVSCTKSVEGRQSRTEFRLTYAGRCALRRYLDHLDALIQAARKP